MSKYIFITGTNTDVGKTFFGVELIKYINNYQACLAFKPIETGCKKIKNKLIPSDSRKYYNIIKNNIDLDEINPYRFKEPVSPYLAIKKAKARVYLNSYINKLQNISKNNHPILIEGAGGAFSPISLDGLNIDLMKLVKSKNILIVKDELGCIGSTLAHYYSFKKYKVPLDFIVLNTFNRNKMDNLNEIKKYIDIPLYSFGKSAKDNTKCLQIIKINLLQT
tara:strand:- start:11543 stop:12205 length:663 start_codon:yes stop_codon:yes gene_type:complete